MNAPFRPDTAVPELTEHQARANEHAARIAAREVWAHYLRTRSADHLASYEAWQRGERSWPWPDPTAEEQARADDMVRGLVRGLG